MPASPSVPGPGAGPAPSARFLDAYDALVPRGNVTTQSTPPMPTASAKAGSSHSSAASSAAHRPWLLAVVVAGAVTAALLAAAGVWFCIRRRRRYRRVNQSDAPSSSSHWPMDPPNLAAHHEAERRAMIRKSLISRSSGNSGLPPMLDAEPPRRALQDWPAQMVQNDPPQDWQHQQPPEWQNRPWQDEQNLQALQNLQHQDGLHRQDLEGLQSIQEQENLQHERDMQHLQALQPLHHGDPEQQNPPDGWEAYYSPYRANLGAYDGHAFGGSLRADWKTWEAEIQRRASRTTGRHPVRAASSSSAGGHRYDPIPGCHELASPEDGTDAYGTGPPIPLRSQLRPLSVPMAGGRRPEDAVDTASPSSVYSTDWAYSGDGTREDTGTRRQG